MAMVDPFNFLVISSSIILIKITIAINRDPKAMLPNCRKDLPIDFIIGWSGSPWLKYQMATVEDDQYAPSPSMKNTILNIKIMYQRNPKIYRIVYICMLSFHCTKAKGVFSRGTTSVSLEENMNSKVAAQTMKNKIWSKTITRGMKRVEHCYLVKSAAAFSINIAEYR